MKRFDFWKLSLMNISASPTRSGLTVLGMAIGIGAILAVLTLGDAGKNQVRSEMARLGIDQVWLTAAEGSQLHMGDGQVLSDCLNVTVTEQTYAPVSVRAGKYTMKSVAVGCCQAYLSVMGASVLEGNALLPLEWRSGSRSVLLGRELARGLHIQPGDSISVEGVLFRCAGILQLENGISQINGDEAVFIPAAVISECFGSVVHEITLSVPGGMTPQSIAVLAGDAMRTVRQVETKATTMQVQIKAANGVMAIFVDVLKWVAFICILVGGIGVMNILLVSVRERKREIGVMKALGATSGQICRLFLLEALIYAVAGGVLGLLIGLWLISTAGASIGLHPVTRGLDCLLVFVSALTVGLCSGVLPASRAAGLHPVDALRDE